MQIGIEHEVGVIEQARALADKLGYNYQAQFNVYTTAATGTDNKPLEVAFDKEYYQTQYEVKFKPFDATVENITLVANYFDALYGNHESIQNNGPDFVGTHIHIFNNYSPTHRGLIHVIARTFREMADFWKSLYEDDRVCQAIKERELKRLCTSNNLLKFFDNNILFSRLKKIQDNVSINYQYRDIGNDRPKYGPVIWSPSRGGKAYSLELRYISNTYFLLEEPEKIKLLVDDCKFIVDTMTQAPEQMHTDTLPMTIKDILTSYITLISLLYGTQNNRSLRDTEELIRQLLPLAEQPYAEDRLRLIREVNMNMIPDGDIYARSHRIRNPRTEPVFYEDEGDGDGDGEDEWTDDDSEEEVS